jgi:hypothetical protein
MAEWQMANWPERMPRLLIKSREDEEENEEEEDLRQHKRTETQNPREGRNPKSEPLQHETVAFKDFSFRGKNTFLLNLVKISATRQED